ncbi:MAG: hypothetical protein JW929_09245 [Anaerolineales bacterium]|nr:hypothetical protein [Anaerolineales bacterium]
MAMRYWFGSVLVLLGGGLFLDRQFPELALGSWIARLWPLAIILLGAVILLTRSSTRIGGMIIVLAGVLLQILMLGILGGEAWGLAGPILLILLGALVLLRPRLPGGSAGKSHAPFQHFIVFGGMDIRHPSAEFDGGSATVLFGGIDLDLRSAVLAPEGGYLELTAAFGGIDVIVPKDWRLDIDGLPVFGGWSNNTNPAPVAEGPVLTVRCLAMFGGVEIKN